MKKSGAKSMFVLMLWLLISLEVSNAKSECPEIEKQALICFKQSLEDPWNQLSSWNISREVNCCKWDGVVCSNLTGNVHQLNLNSSNLDGKIDPCLLNLKQLKHLDLSGNNFDAEVPAFIGSLTSLEYLSLSRAGFRGKIPTTIGNLSRLHTLDLSHNQLSGKIPTHIANLCKLETLDLCWNMLQGEVSDTFGNMSHCFLGSLKSLLLCYNQLTGHLTHQFGEFRNLEALQIQHNLITGQIPINLGNLSQINDLSLEDNKFLGNLPVSIGELSKLEYLSINNNIMTGVVTETHFANLTNLRGILASGNHLTLKVGPNWSPPFKVSTLELGSWNLGEGSSMPLWLETQKNTLFQLDLSNTGITGTVPAWLWEISNLNLSHNHLYGKVPDITGIQAGHRSIYLNSNQFSGLLPLVGNSVEEINLSNNSFSGGISHFLCDPRNETYRLQNLHLGGNQLAGEIPDCWMKWPYLKVVNLGNNNFSGTIPTSMGFLTDMLSLNLFKNTLSGKIPVTMRNCTQLVKMDLSSNNLVGNMPKWIGQSLPNLRFLILHSNNFHGTIPSTLCHLSSLQILDLSNNSFSGRIPTCVNNFTAMAVRRNMTDYIAGDLDYSSYVFGNFLESATITTKGRDYEYGSILSLVNVIDLSKNNLSGGIPEELTTLVELIALDLSWNHLTGLIPKSIGELKQLESLDFSRNILSGEIPDSFTVMSSLSYLNLSYNNLTGRIPEGTQLRGMDASSFIGNNLCGPPLTRNCSGGNHDENEVHLPTEDHKSEVEWIYVVLSLGYAVGFSVFWATFVLKKSWRNAYWRYLECKWDKLYVYYHINLARAKT